MSHSIGWTKFATKSEAEKCADNGVAGCPTHFNVREIDWTGPGWYLIEWYRRRCPRNCCDDYCIAMTPASKQTAILREEITALAEKLKVARIYEAKTAVIVTELASDPNCPDDIVAHAAEIAIMDNWQHRFGSI